MEHLFERDPNQDSVPPNYTAYLLRAYIYAVSDGAHISRVDFVDGQIKLTIDGPSTTGPTDEPTISRLFVHNNATIDPRVHQLSAPPRPKRLLEQDQIQEPRTPGFTAYRYRSGEYILENAVVNKVERRGITLYFSFENPGQVRAPAFNGEDSRILIKDGAIDPRAFTLFAEGPNSKVDSE